MVLYTCGVCSSALRVRPLRSFFFSPLIFSNGQQRLQLPHINAFASVLNHVNSACLWVTAWSLQRHWSRVPHYRNTCVSVACQWAIIRITECPSMTSSKLNCGEVMVASCVPFCDRWPYMPQTTHNFGFSVCVVPPHAQNMCQYKCQSGLNFCLCMSAASSTHPWRCWCFVGS